MSTVMDLDALVAQAALQSVRIGGVVYPVRPMTGALAHKIALAQEADTSGAAMLGALLDVVRKSIPDLPAEVLERLTVEQIAAVVRVCSGQVSAVEASIASAEKNG